MKRLISCQGCRLCIRCDSIPATPFLLDRCQSGKDLLRNFPDLVLPVLQIFDILRIDGAGLIGSFCVLIQVVAAVTEKPFSRPYVHLQLEKGIKK